MKKNSIRQLILDFFRDHPNQDIEPGPVVEWVRARRIALGYPPPKDVSREIREQAKAGQLIWVKRGVYRDNPNRRNEEDSQEFADEVKQAIFERDNYRCVVCNLGEEDGVLIAADHKIPKAKDGPNTLENGQTLCYKHNAMKRDYSQTEAGKRFFVQTYELAVEKNDDALIAFCKTVFDAYDDHDIDTHINRPDT